MCLACSWFTGSCQVHGTLLTANGLLVKAGRKVHSEDGFRSHAVRVMVFFLFDCYTNCN